MTDPAAAAPEAPAPADETALMEAVWDKAQAEGIADEPATEEEPAAPPEAAQEEPAAPEAAPVVEAPTELPAALRDRWAEMPEPARDAVLAAHRDLNRKLAEQGRVVQAAKPVYDVILDAAREFPSIQKLTPAQLAKDVHATIGIIDNLNRDPLRTILSVAHQRGVLPRLAEALTGQPPTADAQANARLVEEVRSLRAQLAEVADPRAIETRIERTLAVKSAEQAVASFAAAKPHWSEVEAVMPTFVALARQQRPDASPQDTLDAAYDMAVHANPTLRAKVAAAAAPAPAATDPQRTEAQLKAKAANIGPSRPNAPGRPLTERQAMEQVWDRLHS